MIKCEINSLSEIRELYAVYGLGFEFKVEALVYLKSPFKIEKPLKIKDFVNDWSESRFNLASDDGKESVKVTIAYVEKSDHLNNPVKETISRVTFEDLKRKDQLIYDINQKRVSEFVEVLKYK